MRSHLVSIVLTFLFAPACADLGEEPQTGEEARSISGSTLETMVLDSPVIRGFIADGTGCSTLGPPIVVGNSITFILTDYIAEVEGTRLARATCDPAVEIGLPAGVTISLENVIYRGFKDGAAVRSIFFREYFFAGVFIGDRRFTAVEHDEGGRHTLVQDDSDEYLDESGDFTIRDSVRDVGVSPCGGSAVWRTNTSIQLRGNTAASFGLISFDTVDVANRYFVTFEFGSPAPCR